MIDDCYHNKTRIINSIARCFETGDEKSLQNILTSIETTTTTKQFHHILMRFFEHFNEWTWSALFKNSDCGQQQHRDILQKYLLKAIVWNYPSSVTHNLICSIISRFSSHHHNQMDDDDKRRLTGHIQFILDVFVQETRACNSIKTLLLPDNVIITTVISGVVPLMRMFQERYQWRKRKGWDLMYHAVISRSVEMLRFILSLEECDNDNQNNLDGITAFSTAAMYGEVEMMRVFLDSPLMQTNIRTNYTEIYRTNDDDNNSVIVDAFSPMFSAIHGGSVQAVLFLLFQHYPPPELMAADGFAFRAAVQADNVNILRLLQKLLLMQQQKQIQMQQQQQQMQMLPESVKIHMIFDAMRFNSVEVMMYLITEMDLPILEILSSESKETEHLRKASSFIGSSGCFSNTNWETLCIILCTCVSASPPAADIGHKRLLFMFRHLILLHEFNVEFLYAIGWRCPPHQQTSNPIMTLDDIGYHEQFRREVSIHRNEMLVLLRQLFSDRCQCSLPTTAEDVMSHILFHTCIHHHHCNSLSPRQFEFVRLSTRKMIARRLGWMQALVLHVGLFTRNQSDSVVKDFEFRSENLLSRFFWINRAMVTGGLLAQPLSSSSLSRKRNRRYFERNLQSNNGRDYDDIFIFESISAATASMSRTKDEIKRTRV